MVRSWVRSCAIQSTLASFTLTVRINALYNESVQRQEQHSSGIKTKNIDLIAVKIFRVGQRFMK